MSADPKRKPSPNLSRDGRGAARLYPPELKAKAVKLAPAKGINATARALGVPPQRVSYWVSSAHKGVGAAELIANTSTKALAQGYRDAATLAGDLLQGVDAALDNFRPKDPSGLIDYTGPILIRGDREIAALESVARTAGHAAKIAGWLSDRINLGGQADNPIVAEVKSTIVDPQR